MSTELLTGEFQALSKRGLTKDTCQKFGIRVAIMSGEKVLAQDYCDAEGRPIAQKVKRADKTFTIRGEASRMGLFGQHLWGSKGTRICITEGELDAAALAQVQDLRWPVVSIPNGAPNAKAAIAKAMPWLLGFDEVVLCFDADEVGRKATADCAPLFPPGRVKIAEMPAGCKDPNDAVIQGKERQLLEAVRFGARVWRPDGIVRVTDIKAKVLATPAQGRPYPFKGLTEATFGRQPGQVIGFGAGTGIGKTDLFTQMIDYDIRVLGIPTGVIYLEQSPEETAKRIAGKAAGKAFHAPDGSWTHQDLSDALDALEKLPLSFYDNWGAMDWDTISSTIRFMAQAEGCQHIYLDHLTAIAAAEDDERKALERVMAEMASMAKSLGIVIHFVSHLTTPDQGAPHEEGGRVTIRQFKGSRAIGFWSHLLFGLERNQQAEDPGERAVTTLRCLKDRATGRATGKTFQLSYDQATGLLTEATAGSLFQQEDSGLALAAGF